MKVRVKWVKSPRRKYGFDRARGEFSLLDVFVAKRIIAESPGIFECPELDKPLKEKPVKVKDTMTKKSYTRPVKK